MIAEQPIESDEDNMNVDPDFVPPTFFIDEIEKQYRRLQLDYLTEALDTERIRYQISSDIEDMSATSLNYFKRMHQEMQISLMNKFCSFVAPGQE